MKPGREVIVVNLQEWEALLERAREEPLDEEGFQKLQGALRAFRLLTELIGEKDATISRLRAVLGKPSTEKTSKVLDLAGLEASLWMPLPPATQWEIVEETAAVLRPAHEGLIRQAGQAAVLYNDDTAMKILALARASPARWGLRERH
jgi:hypothetical protein